jgi:hypothetical protein
METITVKMSWKWGGAKEIACSEALTVDEVAQENGFGDIEGLQLCFVSRGRILSPIITLHGNKVQNGDTILVHAAKTRSQSLRVVRRQCFSRFSRLMEFGSLAEIRESEMGKLADRGHANWENFRLYPILLESMLKGKEEKSRKDSKEPSRTVIPTNAGISETPLPDLLKEKECGGIEFGVHGMWNEPRFRCS